MRFTQTRIATIDVFAVFWIVLMFFFLHRAVSADPFARKPRKFFRELFFCGLCLGMGAATKWIVLYGAVGVAVIFIGTYIQKTAAVIRSRRFISGPTEEERNGVGEESHPLRSILRLGAFLTRRTAFVCAWSIIVFFILPAVIYFISYVPFLTARMPHHPEATPVELVLKEQQFMYTYHAGITATHPYSSAWYEWPVMTRPLWYATGRTELPAGQVSDIYAFGNPAVWWTGTLAAAGLCAAVLSVGFIFLVWFVQWQVKRRHLPEGSMIASRMITYGKTLREIANPGAFILIALAAQYVPWIIIPRKLTFIYHFFASVPFLVFSIIHAGKLLAGRFPRLKWAPVGLLGLALLLFILFYPLLSGALADAAFVNSFLLWFPGWFPYL